MIEFVVVLSFLLLCVKFDFPLAIFNLDLFSPIYYAPDGAIASLDYLVIITMLLLTSVYKFYFKVHIDLKENRKQHWQCMIGIQFFSALFYWAICAMISELLRNSLFNVTFLNLQDISYFSVVAFLLMGIWITIFVLFRNKTVGVLLRHFELKKVLIANFVVTLIVVVLSI